VVEGLSARRFARIQLPLMLIAGSLCLAGSATAVIPPPHRIANAMAQTNRASGRAAPLLFDVSLRIGDSEPVASGVLASHPTGLARLELHSRQGFVERHLLQGSEYTASRDGNLLRSPRPFLPPIFLLQAASGAALSAALASFGVDANAVVLGLADDHDCYVFGGRPPPAAELEGRRLPSLWVDMETFDVVRVDNREGVRFRFGPSQAFEGRIRAPAWIVIEVPGQLPARLDVLRVAPADAPAAAFGTEWLLAPSQP
jgi:hypothetical protein